MLKRFAASAVALITAFAFSPILHSQTASLKAAAAAAPQDKWDSVPPLKSTYAGKKSTPAPRHDIFGIWNVAAEDGGRQASGALEHPALYPGGKGSQGGHLDETGIEHPLPYTSAGLAGLKANKPSGPGVRQFPAALANDPSEKCDPLGFPYMELWSFRGFELFQAPNQVIFLNEVYGNYRIIWTDGRALPTDPDPRWNGYSVGKWVDDYTFVVDTVGLNPKSWIDHAGRPHSNELRVEETFHRVDHDNMELTIKIIDPKMYKEPWLALNRFPVHLLPADFDMPELLCSPTEMEDYNKQVGAVAAK